MWVSGIELRLAGLDSKHLYLLSHLTLHYITTTTHDAGDMHNDQESLLPLCLLGV